MSQTNAVEISGRLGRAFQNSCIAIDELIAPGLSIS
jgi:hypothetical protein